MATKRNGTPEGSLERYLGLLVRFTDYLEDHRDDEDRSAVIYQAMEYCYEWEDMARDQPDIIQVQTSLDMFQLCIGMGSGPIEERDGFARLAERCSDMFIGSVRRLTCQDRDYFAYRVARMFDGNFGSSVLERMLTELVGPTNIGEILDAIRIDLYYRYKDSDDIIFEIMDENYREFAERFIEISRRSSRGKLKGKMTIRLH